MKKIKGLILLGILLVAGVKIVNADSVTLKGDKEIYESFYITLEVTTESKVAGLQMPLVWDDKKVKIVSTFDDSQKANHEALQGYYLTVPSQSGKPLLLDNAQAIGNTFEAAKIYVTPLDDFKVGEETTISLQDGVFADLNAKEWSVKGTSITVKRVAKPENTPSGEGSENDNKNTPSNGGSGNDNKKQEETPNPETGISIPVTIITVAIGAIGFIIIKNKFSKKLYKI